jgi:hypothetical protein
MRGMLRLLLPLILVAALGALVSAASAAESIEHPLRPTPERRALSLEEPVRTVHLSEAAVLHILQLQEWGAASASKQESRQRSLKAVAMALEEYYVMEFSYPESVQQLLDSGYLDEARPAKVELVDFTSEVGQSNDLTLVYVPQPVGRTALISAPGKGCGSTLRSYREYCLAVPIKHIKVWIGDGKLRNTNWMEPFYNFGLHDILRINQENPGASSCASCS